MSPWKMTPIMKKLKGRRHAGWGHLLAAGCWLLAAGRVSPFPVSLTRLSRCWAGATLPSGPFVPSGTKTLLKGIYRFLCKAASWEEGIHWSAQAIFYISVMEICKLSIGLQLYFISFSLAISRAEPSFEIPKQFCRTFCWTNSNAGFPFTRFLKNFLNLYF